MHRNWSLSEWITLTSGINHSIVWLCPPGEQQGLHSTHGGDTQLSFCRDVPLQNLKVDPYKYQFFKNKWPIYISICTILGQILSNITQFFLNFGSNLGKFWKIGPLFHIYQILHFIYPCWWHIPVRSFVLSTPLHKLNFHQTKHYNSSTCARPIQFHHTVHNYCRPTIWCMVLELNASYSRPYYIIWCMWCWNSYASYCLPTMSKDTNSQILTTEL